MNLLGYAGQTKKINVGYVEFLRVRYSKGAGHENYPLRNLNSLLQSEFEKELIDIDTLSNVHNSCMQVLEVLGKINPEATSKLLRLRSTKGYARNVYELIDTISCSSQAKVISNYSSTKVKLININVHTMKACFNNELSNFLFIEGFFRHEFIGKISAVLECRREGHIRSVEVDRISSRLCEIDFAYMNSSHTRSKNSDMTGASSDFKQNILEYEEFNVNMSDMKLRPPRINSVYAEKVFKLVDVHDLRHCWNLMNTANIKGNNADVSNKNLVEMREEIHEGLTSGLHSKNYVHKLYDSYIAKDLLIINEFKKRLKRKKIRITEEIESRILNILTNWLDGLSNKYKNNSSFMGAEFLNRGEKKLSIYHGFLNRLAESNSITASTTYVNTLSDIIKSLRLQKRHETNNNYEENELFGIFMRECTNLSSSYSRDYIYNVLFDLPIDWLRGDTCVVMSLPNKNMVCSMLRNFMYHEIEHEYLCGKRVNDYEYANIRETIRIINLSLLHIVR